MLVKVQQAAISGLIWFGDLNAFSVRQLLIYGLVLPDRLEERVEEERERSRRPVCANVSMQAAVPLEERLTSFILCSVQIMNAPACFSLLLTCIKINTNGCGS